MRLDFKLILQAVLLMLPASTLFGQVNNPSGVTSVAGSNGVTTTGTGTVTIGLGAITPTSIAASGTVQNSITTSVVTNSTAPSFLLNDTETVGSGAFGFPSGFFCPSLTTNSACNIVVGQAGSTGNAASFGMQWAGANSNSSFAYVGIQSKLYSQAWFGNGDICMACTTDYGVKAFVGGTALTNGNSAYLTSATTISSTSFTSTGLVLPSIPGALVVRGRCSIIWEQATAVSTVQFGIANSAAPTNLYVMNSIHYGTGGGSNLDTYTATASTTATSIQGTAEAPGAINTGYKDEIDFTLVNGGSADVITIYGLTGNASDALVIEPGSSCEIFL
ncbi:MAG: hypothetical protein KGL39_30465 [Patescibacteria group bacterium]|nr:hypothetical protein [Patescibacteria group bacterium]